MNEYLLEMQGITKVFFGVRALDNVNVAVKRGEIHALVGENGAGKSTLIKIICGVYPAGTYAGKIVFDGMERKFTTIDMAQKAGIACIHQELNLCPNLSIAENIFLNDKPNKFGIINYDEMNKRAEECLEKVGFVTQGKNKIGPQEIVRNLSIGQKQLVEIAKALAQDIKLLVLDEPTSALTEKETDKLLTLLEALRRNGVTCVYISHKLDEIMRIADSVTILRDGKNIARLERNELSKDTIIPMVVGRTLKKQFPREEHTRGELVMEVKNYSVSNPDVPGKLLVDNVSFKVYKGEITGISGLMGSGRTELVSSIFGAFGAATVGEVFIGGKRVRIKSPSDALENELFLVTEDRKRYGLNLIMSVKENVSMSALKSISSRVLGIIDDGREITEVNRLNELVHTKTDSIETQVKNLSGGNQQKVIISKALMSNAKIIILDEPTRGIDVGAKYEIYKIMNDLVRNGVSIIMISSELEEILGISDRILVMSDGKITAEIDYGEATPEKIMAASMKGKSDYETRS